MTVFALAVTGGLPAAPPASAGGIGDFLSPSFGVHCANLDNGARLDRATHRSTGTAAGNVAGVPLGSALNQCGGADAPVADRTFDGPSFIGGPVLALG
ncbi:hypothetical protein [Streptomyces sp. NPDC046887]|uniref:hypothetical protein n=1 Tax=Streptomyces sp. NPDC046887 TaxID=3155472 RepID=UPI0033E02238